MELDLRGRKHGSLWVNGGSSTDTKGRGAGGEAGILATIYHTKRATANVLHAHRHRITHACFDAKGSQMLTADHRGDIFWFKLDDNYYKHVYSNGTPLTAIAIAASVNRILMADADNWIRCVDLSSGSLIEEWGDETQSTAHKIDINQDETYAVVTCANEALLFQLNPLQHLRNLNGAENVGVQQVFFTPSGASLVTAFKDDSIMLWSAASLQFEARLPIPSTDGRLALRCFAVSRDSKHLLAGGKCRCVFLYNLPSESLVKAIELPESSRGSQTIRFLWAAAIDTKLLMCGVLGHDGVIRFLDLNSAQILSAVGPQEFPFCDNFAVDPNARYLALHHATGELGLYDVVRLLRYTAKVARSKAKAKAMKKSSGTSAARKRTGARLQRSGGHRSRRTHSTAASNVASTASASAPTTSLHTSSHRAKSAASVRSRHSDHSLRRSELESREDLTASAEHLERYLQSLPREGAPILHEALDRPAINFLKLRRVLLGFGEYPSKYRKYIWKRVLNLPGNVLAYNSLNALGIHPAFRNLQETYPLRSRKLQRVLQRTVSCLAHWAPIFGELPYLAGTVFPFVRMFQNNPLEAFEVSATVLLNWCQYWFEFFPNPPLSVLNTQENLLAHHDVEMLQRFVELNLTAKDYVWPLLQSMFSDVFAETEWLRVWDNIVSNHPGFSMYIALAYVVASRAALLSCEMKEDVAFYLSKPNAVDADTVVKLAYELASITPENIDPYNLLKDFTPLTPGTYQVFNEYPEFVVDYQVREHEKIREEEAALLRERSLVQTSDREVHALLAQENEQSQREEMLLQAEASRHSQLHDELARLKEERRKLEELKRQQRLRHHKVYEQSRREFLLRQHRLQDLQTKRMEDEAALARSMNREFGRRSASPGAAVSESVESKIRRKYSKQGHAPASSPSHSPRSHSTATATAPSTAVHNASPAELARQRMAWQEDMSASSAHGLSASTAALSMQGETRDKRDKGKWTPLSGGQQRRQQQQPCATGQEYARTRRPGMARQRESKHPAVPNNKDDDDDNDDDDEVGQFDERQRTRDDVRCEPSARSPTDFRPRRHMSDREFATPLDRARAVRGRVLAHQQEQMGDATARACSGARS